MEGAEYEISEGAPFIVDTGEDLIDEILTKGMI